MRKAILPITALGIIGAVIAGAVWSSRPQQDPPGIVRGSGSIETADVYIAPKIGGRVIELRVQEGDRVTAGQLVARLDTSELDAQVGQAEAALRIAEARLDAALNGPRSEQIAAARASAEQARAVSAGAEAGAANARTGFRQTTELRAAYDAARMRLKASEAQRDDADEALALVRSGARPQQIEQARAAVVQAEVAAHKAEADAQRARDLFDDGAVSAQYRDAANAARDGARAQLDQARAALANLEAGARPQELRRAELGVAQAKANLEAARLAERSAAEALRDRLAARTALDAAAAGAQSARAQARAAAAQLDLLLAGTRPEEIQAARQQAEQAREAVRLARAQRENAFVYAPLDGIVKTKIVEAGETVTAGTPLAVVLDMRRPWLRVFIPETRYGQVRIGDRAEVTVDSFPGDVFVGAVSEIASEAEFTPKNVQSQEERVKLVFGVKIDLRGSDGRLKPGMPADAVIRTAAKRRLTAQSP